MEPNTPRSRLAWSGLALGLAVGGLDYVLFRVLGIEMHLAGRPATLGVGLFFAASYAALGFVGGRLVEARRTIARQLEALEASQRQALENEKLAAIGRLAAGVAHEVRNPLAVIRSAAQVVAEGLEPGGDRHRAGQFIQDEVDRLDRFVRSLLDYSRPFVVARQPVDLEAVAAGALGLGGEVLGQRSVSVLANGGPVVEGDADLLTQVFLCLLVNAAEATGDRGRVEVRLRREPDDIVAEVADDGPGIADSVRPHLFEPFHTTKPDGTGLGLAMAARIVQAHGARIEAAEGSGAGGDGRGACFRVRFPSPAGRVA